MVTKGRVFLMLLVGVFISKAHNLKNFHHAPFFQNGLQAKSGFEMCFGPSTLGAGAKTRLESRIKKFTPHCVHIKGTQRAVHHVCHTGQSISTIYTTPLFFKMACKQNLDLRCVLISDPGTLGAGAKTRLESRIKKFTPRCVYRPASPSSRWPVKSQII